MLMSLQDPSQLSRLIWLERSGSVSIYVYVFISSWISFVIPKLYFKLFWVMLKYNNYVANSKGEAHTQTIRPIDDYLH